MQLSQIIEFADRMYAGTPRIEGTYPAKNMNQLILLAESSGYSVKRLDCKDDAWVYLVFEKMDEGNRNQEWQG